MHLLGCDIKMQTVKNVLNRRSRWKNELNYIQDADRVLHFQRHDIYEIMKFLENF